MKSFELATFLLVDAGHFRRVFLFLSSFDRFPFFRAFCEEQTRRTEDSVLAMPPFGTVLHRF